MRFLQLWRRRVQRGFEQIVCLREEVQTRRLSASDGKKLQTGRLHVIQSTAQAPFKKTLSLCLWNKCWGPAHALTDRERFAQLRSGINENPHWGVGGIKSSADTIHYKPRRNSKGQNLMVCFCCCWAFFFFFSNELTYHERKKWICGDFISSSDPSFTSLTGDSHIYIHSTCHFSCSEL